MEIKILLLRPVNTQKYLENLFKTYIFGPNFSYSNLVGLGEDHNSVLNKKTKPQVVLIFNQVWEPVL